MMKLALRIALLSIVVAGGVAAATTHTNRGALLSHQSATAGMPKPSCGGHMGCVRSSPAER